MSTPIALGAVAALALASLSRRGSLQGENVQPVPFDGMSTKRKIETSGAILYDGPSRINGEPIFAVMTYRSENIKTGDIPQVWILTKEHPHEARKTGHDAAVCGGCIFASNRGCYVNWMELKNIKTGYENKRYSDWMHAAWWFRRNAPQVVRIGAYGDPVAVPIEVWDRLSSIHPNPEIIGYTQMWRSPLARGYERFCMASVKSPQEREQARNAGWRTFRVALPEDATCAQGQITCPASVSEEFEDTCKGCRVCSNALVAPDVAVTVHGNIPNLRKAKAQLEKVKKRGSSAKDSLVGFSGWDCRTGPESLVDIIKSDRIEDLSYGQIVKKVKIKELPTYWSGMKDDWNAGYWQARLPSGQKVYVVQHSGIEFIFSDNMNESVESDLADQMSDAAVELEESEKISSSLLSMLSPQEMNIVRRAVGIQGSTPKGSKSKEDSDKNKYKELENIIDNLDLDFSDSSFAEELISRAEHAGIKSLGSGGTRIVFDIGGGMVAKFDYQSIEGGNNYNEIDIYREMKRAGLDHFLVPIRGMILDGRIILMDKAEPVPKKRMKELTNKIIPSFKDEIESIGVIIEDCDFAFNWGLHEGSIKLLDYGT